MLFLTCRLYKRTASKVECAGARVNLFGPLVKYPSARGMATAAMYQREDSIESWERCMHDTSEVEPPFPQNLKSDCCEMTPEVSLINS